MADLISRTITPPMTIMHEPLKCWTMIAGKSAGSTGLCMATDIQNSAAVITKETKLRAIVLIISLPLVAIPTIHPMISAPNKLPIRTTFFNQKR